MANESWFKNDDYDVVRILFYTSGTEHMKLPRGGPDNPNVLRGQEGTTFSFAWKSEDATITDEEMQQYGAQGTYGENYTFGTPPGRVL